MTALPPYTTGTVTLTNGSAEIEGNGTAWLLSGVRGGIMTVEAVGNALTLETVTADDEATAATKWMGASGTYKYAISMASADAADTVWASRHWSRVVGDALLSAIPFKASGTAAERDALVPPLQNGEWFGLAEPDSEEIIAQLKVPAGWRNFSTRGVGGVGEGGLGLPSPGANNQMPYYSGANTISLTTLTAYARTLLDDANAATAVATLGLLPVQANPLDLTGNKLLRTGAFGLGSWGDLRGTIWESGNPTDLVGRGETFGLASNTVLGVPSLPTEQLGVLRVSAHSAAFGSFHREYRSGGRTFTQNGTSETSWGPWVEIGTSVPGVGKVPSVYNLGNIANDAAVTLNITPTPRLIFALAANTQLRGGGGLVWGNSAGAPSLTVMAQSQTGGGTSIVPVAGGGTLDGTTGPSGSLNIRANTGGTLSIENRTGGTGTYGVIVFEGI